MLGRRLYVPRKRASRCPPPDPTFQKIIITPHRNIKCKMLRCLIHFDVLLEFGGNTHCLLIRDALYSIIVGIAVLFLGKCTLAIVSSKIFESPCR